LTFHVATSKALKNYCLRYYYVNSGKSLVLDRTVLFINSQLFLAFLFLTPVFINFERVVSSSSRSFKVSEVKNYSTDEERDIFATFDTKDQNDKGLPIDPYDLINRLKQAGAMNNATTPSDALDEALNAFDQSEYENIPIE
tara:strand:- start:240 stop:662 length:423 start_codon:yes stop_codon:yes gene_type:complete